MDVEALVDGLRNGDRRTVARLISLVEDGSPALADIVRAVAPLTGGAYVVGITGSPGVGKSTLTAGLVGVLRAADLKVGVLAIDPTSPFTGGALLGDRLRMQEHATDPGVFIRSMATRGRVGGLAWATLHALRILSAAGCEVVVLETVGAGQAEVEVAHAADTTLVVLAPGLGDAIQANKAGILEIADCFVVNKADREGAQGTRRDLEQMLDLGMPRDGWRPPVLLAVAEDGAGVAEIWEAIQRHRIHMEASGTLRRRRLERAAREISEIALAQVRQAIGEPGDGGTLANLAQEVLEGRLDPYAAADKLRAQVGS